MMPPLLLLLLRLLLLPRLHTVPAAVTFLLLW
jgi:hypothetical protein